MIAMIEAEGRNGGAIDGKGVDLSLDAMGQLLARFGWTVR